MEENPLYTNFRKTLLLWHQDIDRKMPWKATQDPYKIWLSEIILQQTRVAQGTKYYEKITKKYPTVAALSEASQDDVLSIWKGLGYYARARNMLAAAKQIQEDYSGVFPSTYEEILSLKGVGSYTAAAIASFAFDLPYAVLDGNVFRVLSRYWGITSPIDTGAGKKLFASFAEECLEVSQPAAYNQAIMDFGALICKPALPNCASCPFSDSCRAFDQGIIDLLPIKSKKIKVKNRYFHYLFILKENKVYLRKRNQKDIWQGLFEPPLIEAEKMLTNREVQFRVESKYQVSIRIRKLIYLKQRLTHRLVHGVFYEVIGEITPNGGDWIELIKVDEIALPLIVDRFLKEVAFSDD